MTTIYVDSRKRVAGSDSNFEVDLGESLHLQSDKDLLPAGDKAWAQHVVHAEGLCRRGGRAAG